MEAKLLTAEWFVDMRMGISYRYVHGDTEYFRPHYHDYYEIFILLDGEAFHLVNGEKIPIEKGTAVFIRPADTHDYVCIDKKRFDMLNITFTAETAEGIFDFLGGVRQGLASSELPPMCRLSEGEMQRVADKMTYIRLIDDNSTDALRQALRVLVFELVADVFLQRRDGEDISVPQWLSRLCEELREDRNFIEGMAAIPRLTDKSREHVARSMKKYYGVTVSEYINDLRLNYIANMLQHSNHNILDIIFEAGFNNVSWCCKCFKKKYGVSMSEYRKI